MSLFSYEEDNHYTPHATDDHYGEQTPYYYSGGHETPHETGGHESGGHALFGLVYHENIHIATYCSMLALIIAAVIAVDLLFHGLSELTDDTPFAKMIHAIEKELMTVGFTAFIFKIIINSSNILSGDYLYALEFADTLVPVYSFCNCFLGLFLVFLSMKQSDVWSKAFHMKLDELLDEYFEKSTSMWHKMIPTAFSKLTAQLEFRIFHNIFCEMFNIHTAAVAFDEYVNCVAEKYVFDIIKISPITWMAFGLIAVFDYARIDYTEYFAKCEESHNPHHCRESSTTVIFVIFGAILLGVVIIFAVVSRYYQTQMIRMKGITSAKMYPAFLQFFEDYQESNDQQRMKEDDLQRAVNEAKAKRSSQLNKKQRHIFHHSTQSSFSIFGVSNSRKNVSKVSPNDVFNYQSNLTAAAAAAGHSEKMGSNGKPPKFKKKKMSIEEEPEVFNQTTELISHAANSSAPPNILRMSIQEIMNIQNLQAATEHEYEQEYAKMKKNSIDVKPHTLGETLRNIGQELRRSIMLLPAVAPEKDTGMDIESGKGFNDDDVEDNGESAKTSDFVSAKVSGKVNKDIGESEDESNRERVVEGKENEPMASVKMRLVSVNAESRDEMDDFNKKKSSMSMARPSPIHKAITDAMNAAGIAHVATQLEDGSYELSVVHTTAEDNVFQPNMPPICDEIEAANAAKEEIAAEPKIEEPPKSTEIIPAAVVNVSVTTEANSSYSHHHSGKDQHRGSNVFQIFLFARPELYFSGSQWLMIFIAMYIAIWLIYFMPSGIPGGWKVLTLVPGVLSFFIYTYIVKVACFLKAIFKIDNEAMLEVVEQTESSKILKRNIIDKLMMKLRSMGDEQAQIFQLFREIDVDDDNALSRAEFAQYLNSLDIFFSRKKWNQVFRDICIYRNNKISFDEFSLFLFPNHGVVLAQEKKRLNKLKHRVSLKSIELVKKVKLSG